MEWLGLVLDVDFSDGDDDFLGEASCEVNKKQLAEIYSVVEIAHLDETPEFDPECDDDDETVYIGNTNGIICFFAAAQQVLPDGAKVSVSYIGEPYWFYHDLIHSEYDSGDGSDLYVDSECEERALIMGAKLAAENGVSIADIARHLAKAEVQFKERFGYEADALGSFLECCSYSI